MVNNRHTTWAAAATLLIGVVLRLIFLDIHGLDADDAFSIALAAGPVRPLLDSFGTTAVDLHPKLYYLLLHVWGTLAGTSHITMKLFSTFCDVLAGAILIRAMPRRLAPTAGLLWATNPLLIAVSAQVRMYALLVLCVVTATAALMQAARTGRWLWWVVAALAALAAAYTHVTGAVVMAGVGAAALMWVIRRRSLVGAASFALAGALVIPYALNIWQLRAADTSLGGGATTDPLVFLPTFVQSLLAHRLPLPVWVGWALVGVLVLILVNAWPIQISRASTSSLAEDSNPTQATYGRKRKGNLSRLWGRMIPPLCKRRGGEGVRSKDILPTAAIVFAVGWAGAGYFALSQDVFLPKYTAFNAPLLLILIAVGVHRLPSATVCAAALIGVVGLHLLGTAAGMAVTHRHDFPAMTAFIEQHGDANDAIIVFTNYGAPPFRYYYDGSARIISPLDGLPPDQPVDELFPLPPADTAWLVLHHIELGDPTGRIEGWFAQRYPLRTEVFPSGAAVKAYDLRPVTPDLPPEATPLDLSYGGQVVLRGYQAYDEQVSRRDWRLHPPSGWVHITLYWEAVGVPFEPVVRLEGDGGAVFGLPIERPTGTMQMHPPTTWQAGEVWRTDIDLNLDPTMPPGGYRVVVRVRGAEGQPLLLDGTDRDWTILHEVRVTR